MFLSPRAPSEVGLPVCLLKKKYDAPAYTHTQQQKHISVCVCYCKCYLTRRYRDAWPTKAKRYYNASSHIELWHHSSKETHLANPTNQLA